MTSARRPESAGDRSLAGLPLAADEFERGRALADPPAAPARVAQVSHLVPCARCGTLNGRSASICWGCDADLFTLVRSGAAPMVERPAAAAPPGAPAAEGPRGLHLVARAGDAASVHAVVPPNPADLPVLTAMVEGTGPAVAPVRRRHRRPPVVAAALVVVALVAAAAALRWQSQAAPPATPSPVTSAAPADEASERSFAATPSADSSAAAHLSFPPLEVLPGGGAGQRMVGMAGRAKTAPPAGAKATRQRGTARSAALAEEVVLPSKPCTANMAALGFCTLGATPATE